MFKKINRIRSNLGYLKNQYIRIHTNKFGTHQSDSFATPKFTVVDGN